MSRTSLVAVLLLACASILSAGEPAEQDSSKLERGGAAATKAVHTAADATATAAKAGVEGAVDGTKYAGEKTRDGVVYAGEKTADGAEATANGAEELGKTIGSGFKKAAEGIRDVFR